MYAIKGIYDGNCFRLEQPIPVFTDAVKSGQEKILDYFGIWDDADSESVGEVIAERERFSAGRMEV